MDLKNIVKNMQKEEEEINMKEKQIQNNIDNLFRDDRYDQKSVENYDAGSGRNGDLSNTGKLSKQSMDSKGMQPGLTNLPPNLNTGGFSLFDNQKKGQSKQ